MTKKHQCMRDELKALTAEAEKVYSKVRSAADMASLIGACLERMNAAIDQATKQGRLRRHELRDYIKGLGLIRPVIEVMKGAPLYDTPAIVDQLMAAYRKLLREIPACEQRGKEEPEPQEETLSFQVRPDGYAVDPTQSAEGVNLDELVAHVTEINARLDDKHPNMILSVAAAVLVNAVVGVEEASHRSFRWEDFRPQLDDHVKVARRVQKFAAEQRGGRA